MDTKRLRQFCAIAETGSLTKAAELLHITHSGFSKSMKLLQDDLGCLKSKELLVAYPLPKTHAVRF